MVKGGERFNDSGFFYICAATPIDFFSDRGHRAQQDKAGFPL
jgi:hypothetical protein